jgi:hypothetical protein
MHSAGTSPGSDGSRAFGLGSGRASRRAGLLVFAALVVALALWLLPSEHGRATPPAPVHRATAIGTRDASTAKYGGLPAWLPKAKTPVGQILHATRARPALSVQGEAISVDLGTASVLATAAGPSVPEEGRTPVPETSPCTFVLTLAHASAPIPISASAFTFVDELGHVRHPHVTAMGGGPPPRHVTPGQTLSLTLSDVLPTGDGALAWAPGGARPIASWDFDVEID